MRFSAFIKVKKPAIQTDEETKYFSQAIKEKSITNVLDGKLLTLNLLRLSRHDGFTPMKWKHLRIALVF